MPLRGIVTVCTALGAGLLLLSTAPGCGRTSVQASAGAPSASTPIPSESSTYVSRGPFRQELLLTGELEAVRSLSIKAPQTAIFQMRIQFMAEEGTVVRKGEPLISFDNSALAAQVLDLETQILDAETQIVAKRSELASALKDLEIEVAEKQFEHDRTKLDASVDPEVLSRKEYGERQLAHDTAKRRMDETLERIELTRSRGQAELDVLVINRDKLQKDHLSAREGLDLLAIEAPADGLVVYETREGTTLRYQEGDSCWPGQGVLRLPDLSEMQVSFRVNEVDAPLLSAGMPVAITLDAFPDRELTGEIALVPSMAVKRDEESRISIFKVIAKLHETWVGQMKPGMSVQGRLVTRQIDDAPRVAREAVEHDGTVYRARAAGDGPPIEIRPLARNASHYLLTEEDYAGLAGRTSPEGEGL